MDADHQLGVQVEHLLYFYLQELHEAKERLLANTEASQLRPGNKDNNASALAHRPPESPRLRSSGS
jgi:hypothetical protein